MYNITIMDSLSISLAAFIIVMGILAVIALLLNLLKILFEEKNIAASEQVPKAVAPTDMSFSEEEKLVVSIVASIEAGKDIPDGNFHISSIKRTK